MSITINLQFDTSLAKNYRSGSQVARILTENWVNNNCYCPSCGAPQLNKYGNNKKVADFSCSSCKSDFELKSKKEKILSSIVDGAYFSMIERIQSSSNPHFFFLNYSKNYSVDSFFVVPKYYFIPEIIQKRKPLSANARRAGWIGCNILLHTIPSSGKIFLVQNGVVLPKKTVMNNWKKTGFLQHEKIEKKGWIFDIMKCIDRVPSKTFSLRDIYLFERELRAKFPNNNFIKDKIRQQLQVLRDKGYLEFKGKGNYIKL